MSNIILVTGTSSGFGNDIAQTLAAVGHRVYATVRDPGGRDRPVAQEFATRGIETLALDVTDQASVDAAFTTLLKGTGGKLDVLINNAGIAAGGLSETFTPEQVRAMFEVNVFGIQRITRAALPAMRAASAGLIVNLGSILGRVTLPFFSLYGASKHAVEALTEGYRYELSQLGIDVVLVQPGPYPTKLYAGLQTPADAGRGDSYGDVARLPGTFAEYLDGLFGSADAPDPHEVAKTISRLIDTPAGTRPNRIIVGLSFGADTINQAVQPVQARLISDTGFDQLGTLRTTHKLGDWRSRTDGDAARHSAANEDLSARSAT